MKTTIKKTNKSTELEQKPERQPQWIFITHKTNIDIHITIDKSAPFDNILIASNGYVYCVTHQNVDINTVGSILAKVNNPRELFHKAQSMAFKNNNFNMYIDLDLLYLKDTMLNCYEELQKKEQEETKSPLYPYLSNTGITEHQMTQILNYLSTATTVKVASLVTLIKESKQVCKIIMTKLIENKLVCEYYNGMFKVNKTEITNLISASKQYQTKVAYGLYVEWFENLTNRKVQLHTGYTGHIVRLCADHGMTEKGFKQYLIDSNIIKEGKKSKDLSVVARVTECKIGDPYVMEMYCQED